MNTGDNIIPGACLEKSMTLKKVANEARDRVVQDRMDQMEK